MSRRAVRGAKRADESQMRAWFAKMTPLTASLGIVRLFPGEDSHFEIDVDPDTNKHTIYVDVELIPSSERTLCKLGFGQDQVYKIPRVDQEVAVLIPSNPTDMIKDSLDNGGIIVAILDQDAPVALDGDDVTVITTPRVIMTGQTSIQLGDSAVPIATKEDVQAIATYLQKQFDHSVGHTHVTPSGATTLITEGAGGGTAGTAPNPTGTTVVTAK